MSPEAKRKPRERKKGSLAVRVTVAAVTLILALVIILMWGDDRSGSAKTQEGTASSAQRAREAASQGAKTGVSLDLTKDASGAASAATPPIPAKIIPPRTEEFVGPLAGWVDARDDYGAVGDGVADDTAAIQKAFDAMRPADSKIKALYFPSGVYRITKTISILRKSHFESTGISVVGEDPSTTTIKWDGPEGEPMVRYGPWHSKICRLTLDGQKKASIALFLTDQFSTANEISDLVVRDAGIGIQAGAFDTAGQAECAVLRCSFIRCTKVGFLVQNWNSLDWWLWNCWFEDCQRGVSNDPGAGNFHVYDSVFQRSIDVDIFVGNLGYFSFVRNVSIGSHMFFATGWGHTQGSQVTMQANTIIDPHPTHESQAAIWMGNPGPWLLLDNVIRRSAEHTKPPVLMASALGDGDVLAIGNTFTVEKGINMGAPNGRLMNFEQKTVAPANIDTPIVEKPTAPPRVDRKIIEVSAGADASAIQRAIDEAAALAGQRPVVHLPAGKYELDRTLKIPANCDLQLIGDGLHNATTLSWKGEAGGGPLLLIECPSHATVRGMDIAGGNQPNSPVGIVVSGCDQPGASVLMNQTLTTGYGYGMVVDGLDHARVVMHNHGHNGINVIGGPLTAQGKADAAARVDLFQGASSRGSNLESDVGIYNVENNARLAVRDIWYEGNPERFMKLSGSGEFLYSGGHIATSKTSNHQASLGDEAPIEIDGFSGRVVLAQISSNNAHLRVRENNEGLKMLMLGWTLYPETKLEIGSAGGRVEMMGCRQNRKSDPASKPLDTTVQADDDTFVLEMLKPLREMLPPPPATPTKGVTCVDLRRIMAAGSVGIRIQGQQ